MQDRPGDPAVTVRLAPQSAIATSSTQGRRWTSGGHQMHHIVDPRSCTPAKVVWRTATVAAATCVQANALSTAALILGLDAPALAAAAGLRGPAGRRPPARSLTIAGFPESDRQHAEESRVS